MPDIHIRIPAQKDMAHARHAVLGLLIKVIGMDPPPAYPPCGSLKSAR